MSGLEMVRLLFVLVVSAYLSVESWQWMRMEVRLPGEMDKKLFGGVVLCCGWSMFILMIKP